MSERKERRGRRRPRDRRDAERDRERALEELSGNEAADGTAPLPPESSPRRIGRTPAVDREAIAAREAGIYEEAETPPSPGRVRETAPPRKRRRRRPRRPEPAFEVEDEPIEDLEEVDWDLPPEEPEPESDGPEPEHAEPVDAGPAPEPAGGEPESTEPAPPEEEEDEFDLGIFEPPPEEPEHVFEEDAAEPTPEAPPPTEPPAERPAPPAEVVEPEPEEEEEEKPSPPPGSPRIPRRWMTEVYEPLVSDRPERKAVFATSSGEPLAPLYVPSRRDPVLFEKSVGFPGEFPFTRGVHATMYRGRLWTMRQYAGFATARDTNERFRYLLEQGQTGLSVAFDLPTQIGYDSDDPRAAGEVGKVGVPINSLADMETLLEGIPLDEVSLSMTINSSALVLLLMVVAVAKKQGVPPEKLRGTVQNDMLKEFVARNTERFSIDAHLRLTTDLFRYGTERMPNWNVISVSGYHMREAGCTAVQEVAFTLANGIAYLEMALRAGLDVDRFARRMSFFFGAHNNVLEEVAKFRAARRLWARIVKDRFGATDPRAMMLRFHTQTCGSTLTASQPHTNVVRVTLQALAAVLGGTQSLHTNAFDEALGLPTRDSALLALRTQQVLAHESGVADVVDPLGGSPLIEELTDSIERGAKDYLQQIDDRGGAVEAIRTGWMRQEIEAAAYEAQKAIEAGEQVVVGVNEYVMEEEEEPEVLTVDEARERSVVEDLRRMREERDPSRAKAALAALEIAAVWGDADLPELILECIESYCTIGEICGTLETVLSGEAEA